MKNINGTTRFPLLTRLVKCLLSLPHSNADTERAFRLVRDRLLYRNGTEYLTNVTL